MKIFNYLLLVLLSEIATHGSVSGRHTHIRIYVPDIVDHQMHTKTVYLHLHEPTLKKPKKTRHKEYHQSNWSSWSSYGHNHDYNDAHGRYEHSEAENDYGDHENLKLKHSEEQRDQETPQRRFPLYNYQKDSYFPQPYEDNNLEQIPDDGEVEKNSYAVHEDVEDIPPNVETVSYKYEEGYRKGLKSESGHVHADQLSKFHENQHEEGDDTENDGYKDDSESRTDAGRYLVDDMEYENPRDKRERRRKNRRVHRA